MNLVISHPRPGDPGRVQPRLRVAETTGAEREMVERAARRRRFAFPQVAGDMHDGLLADIQPDARELQGTRPGA